MTGPLKFKAEMFCYCDAGAAKQAQKIFDGWLEGLPVVHSLSEFDQLWYTKPTGPAPWIKWTHTARLFDVRPIERDTAESLLREAIENNDDKRFLVSAEWYERAKKLLDGEK